jgi:hypothetical protein
MKHVSITLFLAMFLITLSNASAAPTTSVLAGGICINEILPDPNSNSDNFDTDGNGAANHEDEFVELYNLSGVAIDISGWELWDAGIGQWFTFDGAVNSGTTILQPNAYALVVGGVQEGGSLPTMTNPDSRAFDAGRSGGTINNTGDNVVLYNPNADEYIQILFNGATADNPPVDYAANGFSTTASRVGNVEDWGDDLDGNSLTRYPSGDTAVGVHNQIIPGGALASPTAVSLHTFTASNRTPALLLLAAGLLLLLTAAWRRR